LKRKKVNPLARGWFLIRAKKEVRLVVFFAGGKKEGIGFEVE